MAAAAAVWRPPSCVAAWSDQRLVMRRRFGRCVGKRGVAAGRVPRAAFPTSQAQHTLPVTPFSMSSIAPLRRSLTTNRTSVNSMQTPLREAISLLSKGSAISL